MYVTEYAKKHARFLREMAGEMSARRRVPVIRQITQLTETKGIPVTRAWFGSRRTALPGGRIISVTPMHHVYVYRMNGQATMSLTRVDPFQYEIMDLTDLEMDVVMDWAHRMVADGIGMFTPDDGGWFWWRK